MDEISDSDMQQLEIIEKLIRQKSLDIQDQDEKTRKLLDVLSPDQLQLLLKFINTLRDDDD